LLRQEDEKFVVSVSVEAIAAPKLSLDRLRYGANCSIARKMTVSVVVTFEGVDITKAAILVPVAASTICEALQILLKVQPVARAAVREEVGSAIRCPTHEGSSHLWLFGATCARYRCA